jgi:hypothetical protein
VPHPTRHVGARGCGPETGGRLSDALNGICRYYPFLGGGGNRFSSNLARYTHRVAISNRRLISADDKGVTFETRDKTPRLVRFHDRALDAALDRLMVQPQRPADRKRVFPIGQQYARSLDPARRLRSRLCYRLYSALSSSPSDNSIARRHAAITCTSFLCGLTRPMSRRAWVSARRPAAAAYADNM